MVFRTNSNLDNNARHGLIVSDSIANAPRVVTGLSLTNAQPIHVAVVDSSGSQITSFIGGTVGTTSASVNVGQQTSNTTAVQLSGVSTIPTNGIIVQALAANIANVYIGGSGVTKNNGFELQPGQSISFSCNLNTLYVIGNNSTDKVCWNVE